MRYIYYKDTNLLFIRGGINNGQHGCNRGEIDMSKEEKFWRACSMLSYVIAIFIGIASYISNNTVTSVALLWYIAGCKCELNSNFYAIERLNKVNNKVD